MIVVVYVVEIVSEEMECFFCCCWNVDDCDDVCN